MVIVLMDGSCSVYVELHTSSSFSFLDGASLPGTLVERAAELGYPAVALLDRDGLYGAPQFYRAAKQCGIKAIVGAELTIGADPEIAKRPAGAPTPWSLPVLVQSAEGYKQLCRIITRAKLKSPKGQFHLRLEELAGQVTGLIALAGRPALEAERHGVGGLVTQLTSIFGRGNVWVELQRHFRRDEQSVLQSLMDLAAAFRLPLMASNGVRFASPDSRPLYDVLTCIRHKTTLEKAGRLLTMNAERFLKPPEKMARLFADLPQAIAGTEALAERLEFTLANLGYRFPDYPVPEGESQSSFLRRIAQVGARDRYRPYHDKAKSQIARELDLIEKLDLAGYFLIVWDIVNFCRQQGILVQGRGSAANSAVCYALGITAVDPVGMDLLFERFLSEERGEWPDIDLDLPSGDRRERVIQYVYERYGKMGAAMTANVITYRGRSAAREVGKVMGFTEPEIDRMAKGMVQFEFVDPEETIAGHARDAGLDVEDPRTLQFMRLWREAQDLPRHLGQHSGGMVVCQGRLDEVVPLENASMPGRVVVQWDKDDCADLGIIKVDLLGLGMLAVIEEAITIVNSSSVTHNLQLTTDSFETNSANPETNCELLAASGELDLAHLPPNDPAVYDMFQKADTVGIFQIESRAQMATLPRMKPVHFYDLVVEVAIIRPGPIVGKMVHPYLARRRGDEPVTYAHPSLEPVLKRTLGVPLFQEQLLKMAMVVANFSGGEAEELRRAMGFKRSAKRMKAIEQRLRDGMAQNGITGEAADQIVLSISSFALYGFPESHAASFALLVYASGYLKAHYPAAFYTALLNNQPMGFYHPATLVKDAQRRGVRFHPIDVQVSDWPCTIEQDGSIRLGLLHVHGLNTERGKALVATRVKAGKFRTIDDLAERTGLRQDELRTLAEIGALASFGGDRRSALWQADHAARPPGELFLENKKIDARKIPTRHREPVAPVEPVEPESQSPLPTMTLPERIAADYAGTGLTIGAHPMAILRPSLSTRGVARAVDLPAMRRGRRVRVAGAVIVRQRPGTAKGFVFLTMEDETGLSNIIITPDTYQTFKRVVVDEPYLLVEGTLQNQDGAVSVKAERIESLKAQTPEQPSRDFH
jgi:error-prone DNA polymerase